MRQTTKKLSFQVNDVLSGHKEYKVTKTTATNITCTQAEGLCFVIQGSAKFKLCDLYQVQCWQIVYVSEIPHCGKWQNVVLHYNQPINNDKIL